MTDNTQELDEILRDNLTHDEYQYTDKPHRMKQALLDWHNRQTLELLDRLESLNGSHPDSYIATFIEAERNKLKEVK